MPLVDRAEEEIRKLEDILTETFQPEKKKEWTITAATKPEQNTKNCGKTSKLLTDALLEYQEKRNRAEEFEVIMAKNFPKVNDKCLKPLHLAISYSNSRKPKTNKISWNKTAERGGKTKHKEKTLT